MKKFLLVVLMVLLVFMCFACNKGAGKDLNNNKYIMDIVIDEDINAKQTLIFNNTLKDNLNELKFHLYANAYSENAANKAYKDNLLKYGGIEIISLKANGNEAYYSLNQDNDMMTVKIPKLKMNEKVEVYMEYKLTLPECNLRLGKYNDMINLGNFYPVLAYYENDKWREDSFTIVGDPFLSSISDYEVTVTAPANMIIACTGDIESSDVVENVKTIKVNAENVRDFALVASNKFNVMTKMVKKTTVYYYYYNDEEPGKTLNTAANALNLFSNAFGKYPYNSYRVVETAFAYGGMEYPMLAYISSSERDKENVVVHETAHQWWSLIVGNDSINESFIDEGLATFSASYYYLLNKQEDKFKEEQTRYNTNYLNFIKLKKASDPEYVPNMNMPLKDFEANEYNAICYDKASVMFKTVYDFIGRKKFEKSLRIFYEENQYRVAKKENLYEAFNKGAGTDIGRIFESWIEGSAQTFSMQ